MSETDKTADELVTIAGGVDLEVHFSKNGNTSETVKVRQIPISKLQEFLFSMGDESRLIELYCDRPKGWADTLAIESANEIADKGQELNLPFLQAWWRRQAKWRKVQNQILAQGEGVETSKSPTTPSASVSSAPQSPITTT